MLSWSPELRLSYEKVTMSDINSGICFLCNQEIQHRFIGRHINKCLRTHEEPSFLGTGKIFLLKVATWEYYWLFIEINDSVSLGKLDAFLRKTWLECCDHESEFTINEEKYLTNEELRIPIRRAFNIGDEFEYCYDFGYSTELKGKVISARPGKLPKGIRLVARNNLPSYLKCHTCEKYPEAICTACHYFCCQECKSSHYTCEGPEFVVPVVNSPRMGVCLYTGED